MTDFDFNTSTPSNNAVPASNAVPDGAQSGNAGYGGVNYGNAIPDGNPDNFRTPNPQPEPESFNGPVAAAAPSPKLGGKTIAIIAGLSLVCGLIGGVGGAFAMNAISGSGQQQTSQQGPGGQSNGQMGEPPSGQPGQGGSGSGQGGSSQSGQQGGSGSSSGDSSSSQSGQSGSGSNSSSSYLDAEESGTIAS